MNEQRSPIPYGYKAYNGTVWCDYHIDRYNAMQEEINKHTRLAGKAPESLLNGSHKMFCLFSEV